MMKQNNYTSETVIKVEDSSLNLDDDSSPSFLIQKNAMSKAYYKISPMGKKLISMAMAVNNMRKTILNDTHYFEAKFSFQEFFSAMGIEVGGMSLNRIVESANECVRFAINFHTDDMQNFMPLFSLIQIDRTNHILRFVFNPIINDFLEASRGHHRIDFLEYGKLRSTYSMRFYDIFEQLRGFAGKNGNPAGTWTCTLSFEELRSMFQLGELYNDRPDNFKKFVVDAPVSELNEKMLSMRVVCRTWNRTGRKHTGVTFTIMTAEAVRSNVVLLACSLFLTDGPACTLIRENSRLFSGLVGKAAADAGLELKKLMNSENEPVLHGLLRDSYAGLKKILTK